VNGDTAPASMDTPPRARGPRRPWSGVWNVYFTAKLVLHAFGAIGFHALPNLALLLFVAIPIRRCGLRRLREAAALLLAGVLLYHDAWLPPLRRLLERADHVERFTPSFMLEFVARFLDPRLLALVVGLGLLYRLLSAHARLAGHLVFATLAALAVQDVAGRLSEPLLRLGIAPTQAREGAPRMHDLPGPRELDQALDAFHQREQRRRIVLRPQPPGAPPFDILFLHLCSLSWDDLRFAGLENHPVWSDFDFLFRRFNSAASYSTPAAVRLLRATCGQGPHAGLETPAEPGCLLFEQLRGLGFDTAVALNHNGRFDHFLGHLRANGLEGAPLSLTGLTHRLEAFDGSPVYDDGEVLRRWWTLRRQSTSPRTATYYNTITLHDGNRLVEGMERLRTSRSTYRARLRHLLDQIHAFLGELRAAGRPMVVLVIPEHGANMQGERLQVAGLREIPTPHVTRVPVGVALIGARSATPTPVEITSPTSYLALTALLERILATDPFGRGRFDARALASGLPATPFVAENAGTVVLRRAGRYYLRFPGESWIAYPQPLIEWPRWARAGRGAHPDGTFE